MSTSLPKWVKMPSRWINEGGLRDFRWQPGEGANHLAALMLFAPLLHHMNPASGVTVLTYDNMEEATGLSRSMVSRGLGLLEDQQRISRLRSERSSYQIEDYDPEGGWAVFPARALYLGRTISAFSDFLLRKSSELHALKLYYLFAARRDRNTNYAHITFDQIEGLAGLTRSQIKPGLSLLAVSGLVHVEYVKSQRSEHGIANAYRLAHIDSYRHRGTTGRADL